VTLVHSPAGLKQTNYDYRANEVWQTGSGKPGKGAGEEVAATVSLAMEMRLKLKLIMIW
jgi:hypothetical protein